MSRTTSAELAAGVPRRARERPAGAREPEDPGNFYRVDPGEQWPEYFPAGPGAHEGLAGVKDATARAAWLSVAQPPQAVTRAEPGKAPRITHRFRGGQLIAAVAGAADREQKMPETRTRRELEFEPEDGGEGELPSSFRLVAKDTPQQRDGRRHDGWTGTAPASRTVLAEGLNREALQAHISDAVSWLAYDGSD